MVMAEGSKQAFRVRAYEKAVTAVHTLSNNAADMSTPELERVPGIGKSTAAKIREYVDTGSISRVVELRKRFPREMMEMTRIPGLGPKTVVMLRDQLGVASVEHLKQAIADDSLQGLPGLGAKSQQKIAAAIDRLGASWQGPPHPDLRGDGCRPADHRRAPAARLRHRCRVVRLTAEVPRDHRRHRHRGCQQSSARGNGSASGVAVGRRDHRPRRHQDLGSHRGRSADRRPRRQAEPVRSGHVVLHRLKSAQHRAAAASHRPGAAPQRIWPRRQRDRQGGRVPHGESGVSRPSRWYSCRRRCGRVSARSPPQPPTPFRT